MLESHSLTHLLKVCTALMSESYLGHAGHAIENAINDTVLTTTTARQLIPGDK